MESVEGYVSGVIHHTENKIKIEWKHFRHRISIKHRIKLCQHLIDFYNGCRAESVVSSGLT